MKKQKDFIIRLTSVDYLDVKLILVKVEIIGFVLNYRTKIVAKWHQVYRVDTCHDYLHEQRFWLSPEPIPLPRYEATPLKFTFEFFMEQLKNNFERYKKYYIERVRL